MDPVRLRGNKLRLPEFKLGIEIDYHMHGIDGVHERVTKDMKVNARLSLTILYSQ